MKARQLAFDLPHREARGRGDFFVSDSNAAALAAIERWRDWPGSKLVLTGPAGAGKSHLAQVWADLAGAENVDAKALGEIDPPAYAGRNLALEDADRIAGDPRLEEAAFHLHNLVLAEGGHLLVTAAAPPARWGLGLPDLESRMEGATMVAIEPPDEALLSAMLVKLFTDRQIDVTPQLIAYLVARIDRSFASAGEIVARLDAAGLETGRRVSRDLARSVLRAKPSGSGTPRD